MLEQEKTNRARLIGYGIGLLAVIGMIAWKFLAR
jgi:hypothetical protein